MGNCELVTWCKRVMRFHKMKASHKMVMEVVRHRKLMGKCKLGSWHRLEFHQMRAFHMMVMEMVRCKKLMEDCKLEIWCKPVLEFHKMRASRMMVVVCRK